MADVSLNRKLRAVESEVAAPPNNNGDQKSDVAILTARQPHAVGLS